MRYRRVAMMMGSAALVAAGIAVREHGQGAMLDEVSVGRVVRGTALDDPTGQLYVADSGPADDQARLQVIDVRTGHRLRIITLPGSNIGEGVVVDARTQRLFVPYGSGTVAALGMLDLRHGVPLRPTPIPANDDLVALDQQRNRVYAAGFPSATCNGNPCGTPPSTIGVLDARTGARLRALQAPDTILTMSADDRTGRLVALAMHGSGSSALRIDVFDAGSGRLARRIAVAGAFGQIALDPDTGRAFVAVTDVPVANTSRVYVLDSATGRLLRTVSFPDSTGPLAVDVRHARVYVVERGAARRFSLRFGTSSMSGFVATGPGALGVLDARTGRLVRVIPVGWNPDGIAVDERTGHVLLTTAGPGRMVTATVNSLSGAFMLYRGSGALTILDGRSGAVLRRVPVGLDPDMVVVDAARRRVVVINDGGLQRSVDRWAWLPGWLRARLPVPRPPVTPYRLRPASVSTIGISYMVAGSNTVSWPSPVLVARSMSALIRTFPTA